MIKNLELNKKLWLITAILSLLVSLTGLINQDIYSKVVSKEILPGVVSQDLITFIISILLIYITLKVTKTAIKPQIIALSFLAYIFYAYSIYVIEQIYNSFYLFYLLLSSLSFWSIVVTLTNYDKSYFKELKLNKYLKYLTITFLILIPLLFCFLWSSQLLPLMAAGEKKEFTFSIYILDLIFVLPAMIITALILIKDKIIGYLLAPALFFKAFTLLFSVAIGSFLRPLYNVNFSAEQAFFYLILSLSFLALSILNFVQLKITTKK
ncbi:hypothetical protein [Halanaerobium kushneri]|uniref:Uncharacterized protein n=1 Tax=Halanaerobium kushneri TaxID=56779 RepID=A0A1N6PG06_9FIRM|nr:hypothetical protein [Halanaerobium kushneri]SIQ03291.1 hypothetical protein SAMN05421834_10177 [Halanaerobium kushneri]